MSFITGVVNQTPNRPGPCEKCGVEIYGAMPFNVGDGKPHECCDLAELERRLEERPEIRGYSIARALIDRARAARPLPTEATHGMAEQDSVATYRMGQLADALREAGFLVGDGEYDLIIRYATKCIQESGKWVVGRHAT